MYPIAFTKVALVIWVWVETLGTPGEHQNRWYMGVHPPQIGGIGYDPWPYGVARLLSAPLLKV